MIPDRLPSELRDVIAKFPAGALQFEVGVQSFNPEVCERIRRRQDLARLEDNFRFLRRQTGVHLHADLVAGLPGESLESFGAGFDRLASLDPQEIQVGILKRLRGAPIVRHDQAWQMVYNPNPPYEILQNKLLDLATLQRLRRFARYWDLVGNSGNFLESKSLLLGQSGSAFASFMRWSDWLYAQVGRTDSIALGRLFELLFRYLTAEARLEPRTTAQVLGRDYGRSGRTDLPPFLRPHLPEEAMPARSSKSLLTPRRQARHLAQQRESSDRAGERHH